MSSFFEARLEEEFALLTIWSIVGAKPQKSQSCLAGDCSHCSALHTIVDYTSVVKDYIFLVSHSEWEADRLNNTENELQDSHNYTTQELQPG